MRKFHLPRYSDFPSQLWVEQTIPIFVVQTKRRELIMFKLLSRKIRKPKPVTDGSVIVEESIVAVVVASFVSISLVMIFA